MIWQLCGLESFPLGTSGPQKLLGRKVHLLLVGHFEQPKLVLHSVKPVLCLQGLVRRHERGRVGLEEVLVRGLSPRMAGTTLIPTMAPVASAGEAHDSLCHNLDGTSCFLASSS